MNLDYDLEILQIYVFCFEDLLNFPSTYIFLLEYYHFHGDRVSVQVGKNLVAC